MSTFRAIEATCGAVVGLLRATVPSGLSRSPLQFAVLTGHGYRAGLAAGVSLLLHRVQVEPVDRAPERSDPPEERGRALPVRLEFLLTAWAPDAALQHALAGWMMCAMEDHPVLTADLLNRRSAADSPAFRPEESVELSISALSTDELLRLLTLLGQDGSALSIPYQARGLHLESVAPAEARR